MRARGIIRGGGLVLAGLATSLAVAAGIRVCSYRAVMYFSAGDGISGAYGAVDGYVLDGRMLRKVIVHSRFGEELVDWIVEPVDPQSEAGRTRIGYEEDFRRFSLSNGETPLGAEEVRRWLDRAGAPADSPTKTEGVVVRSGWPARCVRLESIRGIDGLRPLWVGLAIDTAAYGGVWWAFSLLGRIRGWNRRRTSPPPGRRT